MWEKEVQSHLTSWQAHLNFQFIKYSKLGQQPNATKPQMQSFNLIQI